jgi:PTS system nitrogen regulatory IIA component
MSLVTKLLPPENILPDLAASSKKRLFEQVGLLFENRNGIARGVVF